MDYQPRRSSSWSVRQKSCRQRSCSGHVMNIDGVINKDPPKGFDLWYTLPLFRPRSPVLKEAPADGSTQWSMMFSWRRGTTTFSMTWSLFGEWNCQNLLNLRQSSTGKPSVKLWRTHTLASWHTHAMTGVMTICSRAQIEEDWTSVTRIPFHGQPSWRSESLVWLGSQTNTNGGCNSENSNVTAYGWILACPSTSLVHRIPIN